MNFEEVIEKLYSSDDELICEVLNEGLHASQCEEKDDAISTGFQCKSHKGTVFDVFYLISQQRVCYFKSSFFRIPIGIFYKFDPYSRLENNYKYYTSGFSRPEKYNYTWNDSYDIETKQLNRIKYKEVKKDDNKNVVGFILENNVNVSSFLIHKNHMEQRKYSLFSAYIPIFYKSDVFSPYWDNTCENADEDWDWDKEENKTISFAHDPEREAQKQIKLANAFIKIINTGFKVGVCKFKEICLGFYEAFSNDREKLTHHFDKIKAAYQYIYTLVPEEQRVKMSSPQEVASISIDNLFETPEFNISNPSSNRVRPNLIKGKTSNIPNTYHHNLYETDDQPTYEKYSGTYVQDVEGYDDDFIDDALGGEPEAYWNID